MLGPVGRGPALESYDLRGTARRIGHRIVDQRAVPARPVERIEVLRNPAADLNEGRNVATQNRHAQRQRLDDRQTETLAEGWHQQRPGAFDQGAHLGIGYPAEFMNLPANTWAALQHVDDILVFPA